MSCKCCDLPRECFDNELDMLSRDSFDGFLDDMIAILILDALENTVLELLDEASLLVGEDVFKSLRSTLDDTSETGEAGSSHLLDDTAAIHLI
jgi:hypothetical protein